MGLFDSNYLGGTDDVVEITLNGKDARITESYEVHQAILQQPSIFALRLGYGGVVKDMMNMWPPNTPFQLKIGGTPRMTGTTDGIHVTQNSGSTSLDIRGRDSMAPLHDAFIQVEKSYTSATYADLVVHALDAVDFTGTVEFNNAANRRLQVGVKVDVTTEESGALEEVTETGEQGTVFKQIQAKVGERWYHFVKRELDRAGLFLWATPTGNIVLSRPAAKQEPVYRILRQRGLPVNGVTVESVDFKNETTNRYSEALVYGRYGGKKFGPAKAKGRFVDQEMAGSPTDPNPAKRGFGYKRPFVAHDVNVSNQKQADFYASRKIAEFRREGWSLQYTVAGHTVPAIGGRGRSVWTPDTVVDVQDDELGIYGSYYIESVTFRRPPTTTTLNLMRLEDLLFGLTE